MGKVYPILLYLSVSLVSPLVSFLQEYETQVVPADVRNMLDRMPSAPHPLNSRRMPKGFCCEPTYPGFVLRPLSQYSLHFLTASAYNYF